MLNSVVTFLDDMTVELIDHMGGDEAIVRSARVSVAGENTPVDPEKDAGLINYLMRKKHGSPFEHTTMTFFVKAPIFVFREFHRHRIASYNEMSGRYTKLRPEFYIPKDTRPLVNVGSSANPRFEAGDSKQIVQLGDSLQVIYTLAWSEYERLLDLGIGNEVARMVLPVGIMSQMYVTMNLRGTFNFLALRTGDERATFPSNPQHEIEMVARKIESHVERLYPLAYAAWNANGRVSP